MGLNELAAGVRHVDGLVAEAVLEPNPARADWEGMRARVALTVTALLEDVLGRLDEGMEGLDETGRKVLPMRVAGLTAEVAVLARLASEPAAAGQAPYRDPKGAPGFTELMERAIGIATDDDQLAELRAAVEAPDAFVKVNHGRWLMGASRRAECDRVMKSVMKSAAPAPLKRAAKKALWAPRAITSAPPLFRLNGCGFGLYGERDRDDDGWHVATYFVSIFFIPVLPLTAYRVRNAGGRSWQFRAKERLGPVARAWQAIVLAGAGVAAVGAGFASYADSPDHKASVALEAAHKTEATDKALAIGAYQKVASSYAGTSAASDAARDAVRVRAESVKEPATLAAVETIGRVVAEYDALPSAAREASAKPFLKGKLLQWADQIGARDDAAARGALTVLDGAEHVAGADDRDVQKVRGAARHALAEQLVKTRPLAALALYVGGPIDAAARDRAFAILASLGDSGSLLAEAERSIVKLARAGADPRLTELAPRREAAKQQVAADRDAAERDDAAALAKAVKANPRHQELVIGLAAHLRAAGDAKGCVRELAAIGEPGMMTAAAQQLLAACAADAGDGKRADAVLTALVDEGLAPFQAAQRAYHAAAKAFEERAIDDAKRGHAPADLDRQLTGAAEKDQPEIFHKWLRARFDQDPQLAALRDAYVETSPVVPAALALGTVKLTRARAASGAEKKRLLDQTENLFLSIRDAAEGEATFHLLLAQVDHRLGKIKEADEQFALLLQRNDAQTSLQVASTLRDLGLRPKARKVAEDVYAMPGAAEGLKSAAASLRAHMADDLEDEETWLKRVDSKDSGTAELLAELGAKRSLMKGDLAEADRAFAKIAAAREARATHDATAANNASGAYMGRYFATGDLAHVRSAVRLLDSAITLLPDAPIPIENAAAAHQQLGMALVLDKWVQMKTLAIGEADATSLARALLHGAMRDALLEALGKEPALRRSLDLARQVQVLAPQNVAPYDAELARLAWAGDAAGLEAMRDRVAKLPPFDVDGVTDQRARWARGDDDAMYLRAAESGIALAEQRVQRAKKAGHKPTIAAACWLLADAYASRITVTEKLDDAAGRSGGGDAAAMAAAGKCAVETWPEARLEAHVAGQSALVAVLRAAQTSPVVAAAVKADFRTLSLANAVLRGMRGPDGAAFTAALRAQPELAEAVRLTKVTARAWPTPEDWTWGHLAGDAELEALAAPAFARKELHAEAQIEALLRPKQPREEATLALFEHPPAK